MTRQIPIRRDAHLLRGLQFKIVLPIVVVMGVLGLVLYVFALRSISDFARVRIQEDLERDSRAVYSICDTALQSLLTTGLGTSEAATRIKQGRVLGEIEDYLRQHNLQAVLYSADTQRVIFASESILDTKSVLSRVAPENVVLEFPLGARVICLDLSQRADVHEYPACRGARLPQQRVPHRLRPEAAPHIERAGAATL